MILPSPRKFCLLVYIVGLSCRLTVTSSRTFASSRLGFFMGIVCFMLCLCSLFALGFSALLVTFLCLVLAFR